MLLGELLARRVRRFQWSRDRCKVVLNFGSRVTVGAELSHHQPTVHLRIRNHSAFDQILDRVKCWHKTYDNNAQNRQELAPLHIRPTLGTHAVNDAYRRATCAFTVFPHTSHYSGMRGIEWNCVRCGLASVVRRVPHCFASVCVCLRAVKDDRLHWKRQSRNGWKRQIEKYRR